MSTVNFLSMLTKLPPYTITSGMRWLRILKLKSIYYDVKEIKYHDRSREKKDSGDCYSDPEDDNISHRSTEALREMLRSAFNLELLTLMFIDDYREHRCRLFTPYIPLDTLRGSNRFDNLRRLSLGSFKIGENELISFLLPVAKTLTHLEFDGLVIDRGT